MLSLVVLSLCPTLPLFSLPPAVDVGREVFEFFGSSPAERFGAALAGELDADGDGIPDLAVGARHADPMGTSSGSVSVYSGRTGARLLFLAGRAAGDWFGAAVVGLGDLNGDGQDEIAVGAPFAAQALGEVSVHSGSDGTLLLRVQGDLAGANFGDALAAPGDLDGDGVGDLVVGAPLHTAGGLLSGRVSALSGVDGEVLWTRDGVFGDLLGTSLSAAGDFDGDGTPDVLVGAPLADADAFNSGAAYVFSGRTGTLLMALGGSETGAQLADRVALGGDFDQDGRRDYLLGAPGADARGIDSGAAEVRSGADGRLLFTIPGSASSRYLQAVAGAGDWDRDGIPDIAVGEAAAGPGGNQAGEVRIVSGRDQTTLYTIRGKLKDDWLGASLAVAGDLDGDGREELLLGAPGHDDNLTKPGSVLVFGPIRIQRFRPAR